MLELIDSEEQRKDAFDELFVFCSEKDVSVVLVKSQWTHLPVGLASSSWLQLDSVHGPNRGV